LIEESDDPSTEERHTSDNESKLRNRTTFLNMIAF